MTEQQKLDSYASEFKKGAAETQNLLNSVNTTIIPEIQKKMQQFYKDQKEADSVRFDADKCMRRFVKMTIDGKVIY